MGGGSGNLSCSPFKVIWASWWNSLVVRDDTVKAPVVAILSNKALPVEKDPGRYVCTHNDWYNWEMLLFGVHWKFLSVVGRGIFHQAWHKRELARWADWLCKYCLNRNWKVLLDIAEPGIWHTVPWIRGIYLEGKIDGIWGCCLHDKLPRKPPVTTTSICEGHRNPLDRKSWEQVKGEPSKKQYGCWKFILWVAIIYLSWEDHPAVSKRVVVY